MNTDEMLIPFYKKIKEIEEDCSYPIESLHVDIILDAFKETVQSDFKLSYRNKSSEEIISELLEIKEKWLGQHLVCQLMLMMDSWDDNDDIYKHIVLKEYY